MLSRPLTIVILVIFAILSGDFLESSAEAGRLKNGVRPGDRSKMHIVRRPGRNTRQRILRPGERKSVTRPARTSRVRRGQQHGWFWKEHEAALRAANINRWLGAIGTMAKRRATGTEIVSTGTIRSLVASHGEEIARAADRHRVSPLLVVAVIAIESNGKATAVSPKGAQGLMQLIPATAKRFGVTDSFDTAQNINAGAAYLSWLLAEFQNDVLLALAGYNAGENAVKRHKGVPPYTETRDYVAKVMDAVTAAQGLCTTPVNSPLTDCSWTVPSG